MDNVITFPISGTADTHTIHSVADALRTCVRHSADSGVIDSDGKRALLHVLDTVEELWHSMLAEE